MRKSGSTFRSRLLKKSHPHFGVRRHLPLKKLCHPHILVLVLLVACIGAMVILIHLPDPLDLQSLSPRVTLKVEAISNQPPTDKSCNPESPDFYLCHLPSYMYTKGQDFDMLLRERAGDKEFIFISLVDKHYVEFAINLYQSSYRKHEISNFLFVCMDRESISSLLEKGLPCFYYSDSHGNITSLTDIMSVDFKLKSHIKTNIALGALLLNYTVVMTDIDVVFLKDPSENLKEAIQGWDIRFMYDITDPTTAFYVARPSSATISVLKKALSVGNTKTQSMSDRTALMLSLYNVSYGRQSNIQFRAGILDKEKYVDGLTYFESGQRMFYGDNPCLSCYVVHCNGINYKESKIYRMKENLLWYVDTNGYYSNPKGKYITYSNPVTLRDPLETIKLELSTLRQAFFLGYLLNRTLILPTFHCGKCNNAACMSIRGTCSLNSYIDMNNMKVFLGDRYREHSFLSNSLVPDSIRKYVSHRILINTSQPYLDIDQTEVQTVYTPIYHRHGALPWEIVNWFSREPFASRSVLQFHSLYGALADLRLEKKIEDKRYQNFLRTVNMGLYEVNYRQTFKDV